MAAPFRIKRLLLVTLARLEALSTTIVPELETPPTKLSTTEMTLNVPALSTRPNSVPDALSRFRTPPAATV